jgi:hypothetical protein
MADLLAKKGTKPGDRVPDAPKTRTVTKVIQTPPRSEDPFKPIPRKPDAKYRVVHTDMAALRRKLHRPLEAYAGDLRAYVFQHMKSFGDWEKPKSLNTLRERLIDASDEACKKGASKEILLETAALLFLITCHADARLKSLIGGNLT